MGVVFADGDVLEGGVDLWGRESWVVKVIWDGEGDGVDGEVLWARKATAE